MKSIHKLPSVEEVLVIVILLTIAGCNHVAFTGGWLTPYWNY